MQAEGEPSYTNAPDRRAVGDQPGSEFIRHDDPVFKQRQQWRWVRLKIKNLLALSVSLKTAIQHGVSGKSYWHMARTPAVQQALPNAWLKAQSLVSVKDLWCKAQGYAN